MLNKVTSLIVSFIFTLILISTGIESYGPMGMDDEDTTSCEEFSKHARFNPYSVVEGIWYCFYYWAPMHNAFTYVFRVPTANQTKNLKEKLSDDKVTVPVNWTAKMILLMEGGFEQLLVERNDRGHYWRYYTDVPAGKRIEPLDVRIKQTGDNLMVAIMVCRGLKVYVLAHTTRFPRKKDIPHWISRIGFRSRKGKSYLYQGSDFMPIPDADEWELTQSPQYSYLHSLYANW